MKSMAERGGFEPPIQSTVDNHLQTLMFPHICIAIFSSNGTLSTVNEIIWKKIMASLYPHDQSPYWWIRFRDPKSLRRRRQSTGFKVGVGPDRRKAEALCAEYTMREHTMRQWSTNRDGWEWVPPYFQLRYGASSNTHERILCCWRTLQMFLAERSLTEPSRFTRQHAYDYIAWRAKPKVGAGKYRASHNTALLELKILGVVMAEAIRRGFAGPANPCRGLDIKKQPVRLKPELTPEIVTRLRELIQNEPEPLRQCLSVSFELAYHHGVRLSGTYLNPMKDVYLEKGVWRITFTQKGGRVSAKILHPNLVPLFERLRAAKATETYPQPPYRQWLAAQWHKFIKRHKLQEELPGLTFHSTRVTVATKLARAGISERKAMLYVDHASTTIHRSYVRLGTEDLQDCLDVIN